MILQKVLAAGRSMTLNKVGLPVTDVLAISKRTKVIATPPREKVSSAERIALSLLITCGITAVPIWIICHILEYGGKKGGTE